MVDFLADDSILLVFLVVGFGAGLGAVRVKGVSVGPAAALFVGLAVGAVDETLSGAEVSACSVSSAWSCSRTPSGWHRGRRSLPACGVAGPRPSP